MKIAFIGTHGTGKTTLAHSLVASLKKSRVDTGFVSEIARECPFPINENRTKKSQIWIILNQIIKEMEIEEKYEVIVSDRSVLDGYCYYIAKFGISKILEPLIKKHMETYDFLIYVPIREKLLIKDKVRSINKDFQKEIDILFQKVLKKFKIKPLTFNKDIEKEVLEKIKHKLINQKNFQ